MKVVKQKFGVLENQEISSYSLKNDSGMEVTCIDYGCIITEIVMPDTNGERENIVLGFDTIEEYKQHSPYFGCVVGRVAGRIKGGQFELDGQPYYLEKNENGNHLHGGSKGFSNKVWEAKVLEENNGAGVRFSLKSPDGEAGYPGSLDVKVTYLLNNENEFEITYEATTDRKTLLNLTNHTYFNLSGKAKRDILDHTLSLPSSSFLELNQELLPTGEILPVEGTPFDFKRGRSIRDGMVSEHSQNLLAGEGYDHPFLLDQEGDIELSDQETGRKVTIQTDQPSVVVYSGNQLVGDFSIWGMPARKYLGICLETQGLPDSIHHPHFPSCILEKGETYLSRTKYKFTV
jgi:aldose 1-epimerase